MRYFSYSYHRYTTRTSSKKKSYSTKIPKLFRFNRYQKNKKKNAFKGFFYVSLFLSLSFFLVDQLYTLLPESISPPSSEQTPSSLRKNTLESSTPSINSKPENLAYTAIGTDVSKNMPKHEKEGSLNVENSPENFSKLPTSEFPVITIINTDGIATSLQDGDYQAFQGYFSQQTSQQTSQQNFNTLTSNSKFIKNSEFENSLFLLEHIGDVTDENGNEWFDKLPSPASPTPLNPLSFLDFPKPQQETPPPEERAAFSKEQKQHLVKTPKIHEVVKGDSLWSIANRYKVSLDAIITLNDIEKVHEVRLGKKIKIPYFSGVYHKALSGESIFSISKKYGVSPDKLKEYNHAMLATEASFVFVPDARIPEKTRRLLFGNLFKLPSLGVLSSFYGIRYHPIKHEKLFHAGIDIASAYGSPVYAAMDGVVTKVTRESATYGIRIELRHAHDYKTSYSHLSKVLVKKGQRLKQGRPIALMGNTGRSTGPHLHFEILYKGKFINPLRFLKRQILATKQGKKSA